MCSDIVNLSKLSTLLSPPDMVTLLDKIQLAVSSAFSDESVYVMERGVERCVVATGLVEYETEKRVSDSSSPLQLLSTGRSPSVYASRLATAALRLLSNISAVKIPKYPRSMLQLRVAVHSGPSQGGVVGLQSFSLLQTPRYQLFGPSLDFSRYLSSTSLPLQVRVSAAAHRLLSEQTEFVFERCPDYPAPNGASIESYWLLDKRGMDINLPSQMDALPLSECQEFFIS